MKASWWGSGYSWDTSQVDAGAAFEAANRPPRAILEWVRQDGEQKVKWGSSQKILCENASRNWNRRGREDGALDGSEE